MLKKDIKEKFKVLCLISTVSMLLTACGGGGGGGGGGSNISIPPLTEPTNAANPDFYRAALITSLSPNYPKVNEKTLEITGNNYIGMYSEQGGKVSNSASGILNVKSGVGIYAFGSGSSGHNYGTINEKSTMGQDAYAMISNGGGAIFNESTGVINVVNQVGMRSLGISSTATNRGRININGAGIGISTLGGTALNDVGGTIVGTTGTGIRVAESYDGTKWVGGTGINKGKIALTGDGAWGMFSQFGNITNEQGATITMNGDNAVAMYMSGTGVATNNGTIILTGNNATGIYAQGWEGSASGINNGIIDMTNATNSVGIHVSGGTYKNNGTIRLGGSGNNREFLLENGASLLNSGQIESSNEVFDANNIGDGDFIMSKNGMLSAHKVVGDIYVDGAGITDLYSKNATEQNAISAAELDINLISSSPMYNVSYQNNDIRNSSYDINVERKNFDEVIKNKSYANLLENNIYDSNNEFKDAVYNKILSSKSVLETNEAVSRIIGDKIFPTIQKINYVQLSERNSHINDIAFKNSFGESFENQDATFFGDFSYSYTDSNSSSTMKGYTENRNTALLGAHKYLNNSLRVGAALSVGKSDAEFSGESTTIDNSNYHLAPFALYKNKDYNLIISPYLGYINNDLDRDLGLDSKNSSTIKTSYYGIYSEINRELEFEKFYVKPRIEVNGALFTQKELDESSDKGVKIPETDYNTFTTGIASSIGKKIGFGNGYTLGLELDGGYYHEFGNPNNELENISLKGFNGNIDFNSYDYNRDYGKVGAEISISKNDVYGYAKYQYIIGQDTDDQKTTVGISYKF